MLQMFFITHGSVEVVSDDGGTVFTTLSKGQFFGEISLVYRNPRSTSVRAATDCDLLVLSKPKLDCLLASYPHIADQICEIAGKRFDLVKKLGLRHSKYDLESEILEASEEAGILIYTTMQ